MTGYGEAHHQSDGLSLAIELRALNNRYLKVSVRASEPYNLLEPEFEKVIRRVVRRGTVQVHVRCERRYAAQDYRINATALKSYLNQLKDLAGERTAPENTRAWLPQLLALPGVVAEPGDATTALADEWPLFERVLEGALDRLQAMRQEEGRAMASELLQHRDSVLADLTRIRQRAP